MVIIRDDTLTHQIRLISHGARVYVSCTCLSKYGEFSERRVIGGPLSAEESAVDRWRTHLPAETILDYIERIRKNDAHIALECECDQEYCMFCDGGLFACVRCGSFEGATTSECSGISMSAHLRDEVYWGYIDFRNGMWMPGVISTHTPVWFSEWNPEYVEWRRLHNEKENGNAV